METSNSEKDDKAIMIFKPSMSQLLASSEYRLPANYVGVRQVRPSIDPSGSKRTKSNGNKMSAIKYLVVDENGNERRMTKAEKKAKKQEFLQQKKQAKQQAKEESKDQAMNEYTSVGNKANEKAAIPDDKYHQMPLNTTAMEQELEEIREEKTKIVPVILSPPMALQFCNKMLKSSSSNNNQAATIQYSHSMSQEWAILLKEHRILPAEAYRSNEDMRPLAYKINPEPWQRLRPSLEETALDTKWRETPENEGTTKEDIYGEKDIEIPNACDWVPMTCRPPCSSSSTISQSIAHDDMLSIVFEYIYRETPYYVSCGAKFGSDFLIYDGPREERHAFAGLRVLSSAFSPAATAGQNGAVLPLPTAFSLTSYVRCLNTAGKLALIATVVRDHERYRVLFIDVALEKVLDAPTHKRKKRNPKNQEKRKDIAKNLAKM
jgi:hypothetical protein